MSLLNIYKMNKTKKILFLISKENLLICVIYINLELKQIKIKYF